MRWLPIKRPDGKIDRYATAYCTHTVEIGYVGGDPRFTAWRITGTEAGESKRLGTFAKEAEARAACVQDAIDSRGAPFASQQGESREAV